MGTHALIGQSDTNGAVTAAYVHYDGYPAYTGSTLAALVARDGLDRVLETLLSGREWLSLDADERFYFAHSFGGAHIAGYGEVLDASRAERTDLNEKYAYIFSADGSVLKMYAHGDLVNSVLVSDLGSADWTWT